MENSDKRQALLLVLLVLTSLLISCVNSLEPRTPNLALEGPQDAGSNFLVRLELPAPNLAASRGLGDDTNVASVSVVVTNGIGQWIGSANLVKQTSSWVGSMYLASRGPATFAAYAKSDSQRLLYAGDQRQVLLGDGNDSITVDLETIEGILFLGNGGTGGTVPPGNTYQTGQTVIVPDNTFGFTKDGFVFCGWNTRADGTGTSYSPGDSLLLTQPQVLHAIWTFQLVLDGVLVVDGSRITGFDLDYVGHLVVPQGITDIDPGVFSGCVGLTEVTLPDTVKKVESNLFGSCTGLVTVHLPQTIQSIGDQAFYSCTSLASIPVPDSVVSIGLNAFQGCTALAAVTLGEHLQTLGDGAFQDCAALATVELSPSTPPSVGSSVFLNCSSDLTIFVPEGAVENYKSAWSEYADHIDAVLEIPVVGQ